MAREPIIGDDNNNWGSVLNTFLSVSHNADGTLILNSTAAKVQQDGTQAASTVSFSGNVADASHVHPAPGWVAADNGLLAAASSLDSVGAGVAATAGTLYFNRIPIRYNFSAGTIWIVLSGAGSGTSTGSFLALYNLTGTTLSLLANTSDIAGNVSSGARFYSLSSTVNLTAGQVVYGAILSNLSVTQPSIRQYAGTSAPVANLNLSTALSRSFVNGTSITSLPASLSTSTNSTGAANPYWVGLST